MRQRRHDFDLPGRPVGRNRFDGRFPRKLHVLNVNNLDYDIDPAANVNGIVFNGTGSSVTINSTLGSHIIDISGTGDGIIGVNATSVTINQQGDIRDAFRGINANTTGAGTTINIDSSGKIINAGEAAINAFVDVSGDITIDHTGDIVNALNRGISAETWDGKIDITYNGPSMVTQNGQDIFAKSRATGDVKVTSIADLSSKFGQGIHVESADGKSTVDSTGTITSYNSQSSRSQISPPTSPAMATSRRSITPRSTRKASAQLPT